MRLTHYVVLFAVLCSPASGRAADEGPISGGVVRIGLVLDLSGPYAYLAGESNLIAARMAVEDFGGTVLGRPVELLHADHHNRVEEAVATAREWFEAGGVDALMDVAGSGPASAVAKVAVRNNHIAVFNTASSSRLTNEACTPVTVHWVHDGYALAHAITPKQLRDPAWTRDWGTSASIMSYARFNYVAQPGDGAGLLPKPGPYDYFAIDWGYHEFDGHPTPDEERILLDQTAARQVSDSLLRFGGEDSAADFDPTVAASVLCGEAISCADLGLRNIDRVMSYMVPATTRTGEPYDRLSAMYEALVQQRHRELAHVAKLVGGVEETRYHAGRGKAPFVPVAPARQHEAVKFLLQRAFAEPKALLDPDVLSRITPAGGQYPLQGSNIDLLRRLIDAGVFERMTEASSSSDERYTGVDLLYDLNQGLFCELEADPPVITPYRRQVQRGYVTLLLTATGTVDHPPAAERTIDRWADYEDPPAVARPRLKAMRSLDSGLADMGKQYTQNNAEVSEFRAALRAAVAELYNRIEAALPKVEDSGTVLHLRLIRTQLSNVP